MESSIEISKRGEGYSLILKPPPALMEKAGGKFPSLTLNRIDFVENFLVELGLNAQEQKRLSSELKTSLFAETGVTNFPDDVLKRFKGYEKLD